MPVARHSKVLLILIKPHSSIPLGRVRRVLKVLRLLIGVGADLKLVRTRVLVVPLRADLLSR